jgi:CRP-like cAMP-binding protein
MQHACTAVFALSQSRPELKGMGTTLSAMWFSSRRAVVAHVGDCRIYLVRRGEAHRLTEDHALLHELIRQGRLSEAEAQTFPYPNAVTRALGPHPAVEVDTVDLEVLPGDRFLLCSDGLHRYFRRGEVATQLEEARGIEEASREFVRLAIQRGGADNITALVIEVAHVDPATTDETERKIEVFREMPLFHYLTYRELMQVLSLTSMRHYKSGQTIIREGVSGDELFIVFSGRVAVRKGDTTLSVVEGGGHFGEMALVDQDPRSASVSATENTRLLVLPRKRLYALLRKEPTVGVKLLWNIVHVLSGRLRVANTELSHLKIDSTAFTDTTAAARPFATEEPTIPPRPDDTEGE